MKNSKERISKTNEDWFRTTIYSIGDGVITTDKNGRVLQMNPVAEKMTGWKEKVANGKSITKIFKIVNETTRKKVENPVTRVLREGIVIGLANHTILISRDGKEYPIADAGAPIRDTDKKIIGVVLVFRDQTTERKTQRAIQEAREFAESIIATIREPLLVLDEKLEIVAANRSFYNVFKTQPHETIGWKIYNLGNRQWNIPKLRVLLEDILPSNSHFDNYEVTHEFEHIGKRTMLLNARRLFRDDYRTRLILLAIEDITDRKKAEQEIREREEMFSQLCETTNTSIFILKDEKFVYANSATEKLSGYTREELLSMRFQDIIHNEFKEFVQQRALTRHRRKDSPKQYELKIVRKDGTERWINLTIGKFNWKGLPTSIGTAFDVTDRKKAEDEYRRSEQLLRTFLNSTTDMVYLKDSNFKHLIANPALCKFYQKKEIEILGKDDFELMPEKDATICRETDIKAITLKDVVISEEYVRGKYYETMKFPVQITETELGVGAFIRDITKRKEAEKALHESEEQYRRLVELLPDGVVVHSEGKVIFANKASANLIGANDPSDLIGKPVLEFVHPDYRNIVVDRIRKAISQNKPVNAIEEKFIKLDGTAIDVLVSASPFMYGNKTAMLTVFSDITDRKKAEQEIRISHQRYERFFMEDLTGDYISTVDGRIIACNPAFVNMFGFKSIDEALATNITTLLRKPEERAKLLSRLQREKKLEYVEVEMAKRDGTPLYIIANIIGRFDTENKLIEIQGYLFDDTKRRQLEESLRHTQKLESLGTLASGIAHDFNNVLGIILGHTTLLERARTNHEKFAQSVEAITSATQRGASLVKQMLTFARKAETVFQPLEINILIKETVKMLRETFPKTIEVRMSITKDLPAINGDATQIHQILLNLCVNARDAMPKGGILTIATELINAEALMTKYHNLTSQRYIKLTVSDTGIGMNEETMQRIFEPFFTTKAAGFGTGLGLSVVHGIVSSHGGFIDVKSSVGKGTTFYVYLPTAQQTVLDYQYSKNNIEEVAGGSETILIVEDEQLLRELLHNLLTSKGYKVLSAEDGLQALQIYKEKHNEISLVISDLGLPKLSGDDVFRQINKINPKAKVILASGFIEPDLKSILLESGVKEFIQKPYTQSEVLKKARNVLDSNAK